MPFPLLSPVTVLRLWTVSNKKNYHWTFSTHVFEWSFLIISFHLCVCVPPWPWLVTTLVQISVTKLIDHAPYNTHLFLSKSSKCRLVGGGDWSRGSGMCAGVWGKEIRRWFRGTGADCDCGVRKGRAATWTGAIAATTRRKATGRLIWTMLN